ncbi:MAG: hypothetical protein LKK12_07425 [Bacteroidales bacterium]|jgi:hypothetical protein|nr:hypothetical protein [Bacteroidales bacterium]MCI2134190.1 hypothetical protein [Bacteroidales bacterium]
MKRRIFIILGIFCLSALPAFSQTEEWRDEYSKLSKCADFSNPAWLTEVKGAASTVRLNFDKTDGELKDIGESSDSWKGGLDARSFLRISDRLQSYGRMEYSYFRGGKMGGPVLLDPYYNPVNFLESTDTTTGTKILEKYSLEGALAYSLNDRLKLAGRFLYESANYAKRKDPRPINKWMDMEAGVGIKYSFRQGGPAAGFGLTYAKTLETIDTDIFGTLDRNYFYLVDYGGIFGKVEQIEGDYGYLSTTTERPMFNQFFGGNVQACLPFSENLTLRADASLAYREGYFGKKASGSVRFCDFTGWKYFAHAWLDYKADKLFHRLEGSLNVITTENEENSWQITTNPGENSKVEYFGKNKAGDKTVGKVNVTYSLSRNSRKGILPSWGAGISYSGFLVDQKGILYPFYRKQKLNQNLIKAFGLKNIYSKHGLLSICGEVRYAFHGDDLKNEDGSYASASGSPRSIDAYLNKTFEYYSSSRLGAGLGVRYSLAKEIRGHEYNFFAEISDSYDNLTGKAEYLTGNNRNKLLLTIGCDF